MRLHINHHSLESKESKPFLFYDYEFHCGCGYVDHFLTIRKVSLLFLFCLGSSVGKILIDDNWWIKMGQGRWVMPHVSTVLAFIYLYCTQSCKILLSRPLFLDSFSWYELKGQSHEPCKTERWPFLFLEFWVSLFFKLPQRNAIRSIKTKRLRMPIFQMPNSDKRCIYFLLSFVPMLWIIMIV